MIDSNIRGCGMSKKITNNQQGFGVMLVVIVIAVLAVGGVGWYVWQAQDKDTASKTQPSQNQSSQTTQASETPKIEKMGIFTGKPPKTGSGSVSLIKNTDDTYTVRLEDDFKVQNGPALFVGFGNNGSVDHDTLFAELKAFDSKQEYMVPDTIDVAKFSQVIIYCKEFSVAFSVADLQ